MRLRHLNVKAIQTLAKFSWAYRPITVTIKLFEYPEQCLLLLQHLISVGFLCGIVCITFIAGLSRVPLLSCPRITSAVRRLPPQSPEAHDLMAKVLVKRKEYNKAVEHYRCVVALAPPNSKMFQNAQKALERAAP